jgi:ABC-type branched-subunit amino acid transport system substrate-binding protein
MGPKAWIVAMLFASVCPAGDGAQSAGDPARGEQIYRTGQSALGFAIQARLGRGAGPLPARLFPCLNCHGEDGRGRPEGGARPADITWYTLTKPYRVTVDGGRSRPPYDRSTLTRAITMGLDASGTVLDPVMPRYVMTQTDILDLLAYLRILGETPVPGVTPERLRLGTILPNSGPLAEFAPMLERVLRRALEEVNEAGGLFRRKLSLESLTLPAGSPVQAVQSFLDEREPFALVAPSLAGWEAEIVEIIRTFDIPTVGMIAISDPPLRPADDPVFRLIPGIPGEARALSRHLLADSRSRGSEAAVVYVTSSPWKEAAEAVTNELRPQLGKVRSVELGTRDDERQMTILAQSDVGALFVLTPGEVGLDFMDAARRAGLSANYLAPGLFGTPIFARRAPPPGSRLALAWALLPTDRTRTGEAQLRRWAGITAKAFPQQVIIAAASAMVLTEALRRAGRDLTRPKLIDALESLYRLETGLMPPVSFGPNRRIGSLGAYVVEFDVDTRRALSQAWISLK